LARARRQKPKPAVVLVVEDEPTVRALSASNIEELGYTTLSAGNGREALALLEDGATVDLLFTDINMPDGPDGLELARQAVELRPELRVLYTTGGGRTDGMEALFVEGAKFLPKPYTREQLIEAIGDLKPAERKSRKDGPKQQPPL
jgi:CheY-like chemotaxis protein